jgi:hypothetical protein
MEGVPWLEGATDPLYLPCADRRHRLNQEGAMDYSGRPFQVRAMMDRRYLSFRLLGSPSMALTPEGKNTSNMAGCIFLPQENPAEYDLVSST